MRQPQRKSGTKIRKPSNLKTKRRNSDLEGLESRTLLSASPTGLTPAEVRTAYGFSQINFTNSAGQTIQGNGAGQTIAIVDTYVSSTITADLNKFDQTFDITGTQSLYTQFGAASTFFTAINLATKAVSDSGWALETALDVEWAHAIAPAAKIDLVEAVSANTTDLLNAVSYAAKLAGVSVVSMSWGGSEFSGESSLDSYFTTPAGHQGITFVAAAGDSSSVSWPAVSDDVLAVGGTTLKLTSSGAYSSESTWNSTGGGLASLEPEPTYQSSVNTTGLRSTPDVAYDADPNTGFSAYTATAQSGQTGWITVGGTSAGAPQWSALIAIANQGRVLAGKTTLDGPTQTLPTIYALPSTDFHDIATGSSGAEKAAAGYDLVTGRGSPLANSVVAGLVASTTTTPIGTIGATGGGTTNSGGSGGTTNNGGSNNGGGSGGTGGRYHGWPPPPPPPRYGRGWSNQPPFHRGRYAVISTAPITDPALSAAVAQTAKTDSSPTDLDDSAAAQPAITTPAASAIANVNLSIALVWCETPINAPGEASEITAPATPSTATESSTSTAATLTQTAAALLPARAQTTAAKSAAVGAFPPTPAVAGIARSAVSNLPLAVAEALLLLAFARRKQKKSPTPIPVRAD